MKRKLSVEVLSNIKVPVFREENQKQNILILTLFLIWYWIVATAEKKLANFIHFFEYFIFSFLCNVRVILRRFLEMKIVLFQQKSRINKIEMDEIVNCQLPLIPCCESCTKSNDQIQFSLPTNTQPNYCRAFFRPIYKNFIQIYKMTKHVVCIVNIILLV